MSNNRIFGSVLSDENKMTIAGGEIYIEELSEGAVTLFEAWFSSELGTVIGQSCKSIDESLRSLETAMVAFGIIGEMAKRFRYIDLLIETIEDREEKKE